MLRASDPNIQFKTLEDFNADYSKDFMPSLSRYCRWFPCARILPVIYISPISGI